MDVKNLKKILSDVKMDKISINKAILELKVLPYIDLGFAKIDTHRTVRKGFPEVIFCEGKTPSQVVNILNKLKKHNNIIMATKASEKLYKIVRKECPDSVYFEKAKIIALGKDLSRRMKNLKRQKRFILVITAGTSDIPVAEEAVVTAETMGNRVEKLYDVGVSGIHRLFDNKELIFHASVIIVIAGMEGALASVVGGLTDKPIIAVPTSIGYGASFKGLSALLTMLNCCAAGVVVVNIDNGFGAGYFASIINKGMKR